MQCDIPGSCLKDQQHDHMQDKMRALSCGIIFTAFLIVKELPVLIPARRASRETYLLLK
jgi:hypothetical protein